MQQRFPMICPYSLLSHNAPSLLSFLLMTSRSQISFHFKRLTIKPVTRKANLLSSISRILDSEAFGCSDLVFLALEPLIYRHFVTSRFLHPLKFSKSGRSRCKPKFFSKVATDSLFMSHFQYISHGRSSAETPLL